MFPLPINSNSCASGLNENSDNMLANSGPLTPTQDSSLNHVPLMMPTVPLWEYGICSVWDHNLEESFRVIRYLVQGYPFVAVTTEFPAVIARPLGSLNSATDNHYELLRCNVDLLNIFQLGLTFMNKEGQRPPVYSTWQFNLKFNLRSIMCPLMTEETSVKSNLNFKKHEQEGIETVRLGELLIISGLVLRKRVKWLAYESAYDFAFLIKILTSKALPPESANFLQLLRDFFPCVLDLKVWIRPVLSLKSDLQEIASYFERSRYGYQQRAGSDAILISMIFFKMHKVFFKDAEEFFERFGHFFGSGHSETNQRETLRNDLRNLSNREPMLPNFEQSQLQVNNNNAHNFRNATTQTNNYQVPDPRTHLLPYMDTAQFQMNRNPANSFGQPITQVHNNMGPAPSGHLLPHMDPAMFQMNRNAANSFGQPITQVHNNMGPAPSGHLLPHMDPAMFQMNRNAAHNFGQPITQVHNNMGPAPRHQLMPYMEPARFQMNNNPAIYYGQPISHVNNLQMPAPRAPFLPNFNPFRMQVNRNPVPPVYNSQGIVPRAGFLPNVDQRRPAGFIRQPCPQVPVPRNDFLPNVDQCRYPINQNTAGVVGHPMRPLYNFQVAAPRAEFWPNVDQYRYQINQNPACAFRQQNPPQNNPQVTAPSTEFMPIEDQSRLQMNQYLAGVGGQLISPRNHPQMSAPRTEFTPHVDQSQFQMNQHPDGAIGQQFPSERRSQVSASRTEFMPHVDQSQFQMNQHPDGAIGQQFPSQRRSQVSDSRTEFMPHVDQSQFQMNQHPDGAIEQQFPSQRRSQVSDSRTEFSPNVDQSQFQMNQNPDDVVGHPIPTQNNSQVPNPRTEFLSNMNQSQFQINYNPDSNLGSQPVEQSSFVDPAQKGLWPNWPCEGEENINLFESLGMKKLPLYYPIDPLPRDGWTNWMSDSELNHNYNMGQQTSQTKKETASEERQFKLEQSILESNFFPGINSEEQATETELSSSDRRLFNLEQGILKGNLGPHTNIEQQTQDTDYSKITLKYSLFELMVKMAQLDREGTLGQHNPQTNDSTMPTDWDEMWNQMEKLDNVPATNNNDFPPFIDEFPIKSECSSEITLVPDAEEESIPGTENSELEALEDELSPIMSDCVLDEIPNSDDHFEESLPESRNEVTPAPEEYVLEIRFKPIPRSGKMKVYYEHLHSNIENSSSLSYAQAALVGIKTARIEEELKLAQPENHPLNPHFWKKCKRCRHSKCSLLFKKRRLPTIVEEECEDNEVENYANDGITCSRVYETSSDGGNE